MTYVEKIIDAVTGKETIREMTPDEIAEIESNKETIKKIQTEKEVKAKAKEELLNRLGITEEEAKLLLG